MDAFAVLLLCATLIWKFIDSLRAVFEGGRMGWDMWRMLIWTIIALGAGVGIAFAAPLNMFNVMGVAFETEWVARLITGLAVGSGATFVHDVFVSPRA